MVLIIANLTKGWEIVTILLLTWCYRNWDELDSDVGHLSRMQNSTSAWLAQLVERQTAVREVKGSSPRPDQHSGS